MRHLPKRYLLASLAKRASIAPNQPPTSKPILIAAAAIPPKPAPRAKPILGRVRELQAEANARQQTKIDLSRERVGRDLDTASRLAKEQGNASAIVSSALGIAKVFHSLPNSEQNPLDFKSATNMQHSSSGLKPSPRRPPGPSSPSSRQHYILCPLASFQA